MKGVRQLVLAPHAVVVVFNKFRRRDDATMLRVGLVFGQARI